MTLLKVQADLNAGDEFTALGTNVQAEAGTDGPFVVNEFNLSIRGTWVGTITLQRSFDLGANWEDIRTFTSNFEGRDCELELKVKYRAGFKTGDFTSGIATVRISQ